MVLLGTYEEIIALNPGCLEHLFRIFDVSFPDYHNMRTLVALSRYLRIDTVIMAKYIREELSHQMD